MRQILAALAVLFCLAVPATAEEIVSEVSGAFAYADSDDLNVWNAAINLDFPVGQVLQIGPALQFHHFKDTSTAGIASINTHQIGGRATLNFTGRDGLFVALSALYHDGDVPAHYTAVPEIGVKFGSDGGFVRVSIARPYQIDDEDESLIDLEQTQVAVGLGLRF